MWQTHGESAQRKEREEKWKRLTGTRSGRETVKSGRCAADRVCLEGTAADWWNESSSGNQRTGCRVIKGRKGGCRARSQRCGRKPGSACVCANTCWSFPRLAPSCSCSLSASRCWQAGSAHRTRASLLFKSQYEGMGKYRGPSRPPWCTPRVQLKVSIHKRCFPPPQKKKTSPKVCFSFLFSAHSCCAWVNAFFAIHFLWLDGTAKKRCFHIQAALGPLWRRQFLSQKIKSENLTRSVFLLQIDVHNARRMFTAGGAFFFQGQFSFNSVASIKSKTLKGFSFLFWGCLHHV